MNVTAIIAEYNPIHSGHVKHIKTAREETGADRIISVMSGDYVQRGCPAIISKYERAREALLAGADLVLELPLYYSAGSLDYFAHGAVSLIKEAGIVSCISFGSECGDLQLLKKAAGLTSSLDKKQNARLKDLLSKGYNYSYAINEVLSLPADISDLLKLPNNLLGVAYIKAAADLSFDCDFHTMKREGSAYHDDSPSALSSTSIRRDILTAHDSDLNKIIGDRMPDDIKDSLIKYLERYHAMCEDDLSLFLYYKVLSLTGMSPSTEDAINRLTSYLDVSPALAGKIIGRYSHAASFSSLCDELKSRDLNRSRISRALLHIILDIKKENMDEYAAGGYNYYLKPLGFLREASSLLHAIKKEAGIPIISKNADAASTLKAHYQSAKMKQALKMFNEGIQGSDLYNKTACSMSGRPFISEYEQKIITL